MNVAIASTGELKKVRTAYNFDPEVDKIAETPYGESKTQPDMTMPMRELLARFQRGQVVTQFNGTFLGADNDLPEIERMRKIDIVEMHLAAKDFIEEQRTSLQTRISDRKQKREQKEAEEAAKKAAEPEHKTDPNTGQQPKA